MSGVIARLHVCKHRDEALHAKVECRSTHYFHLPLSLIALCHVQLVNDFFTARFNVLSLFYKFLLSTHLNLHVRIMSLDMS